MTADSPSPSQPRPQLLGLRPAQLVAHLASRGVASEPGDVRRLMAHVISHGEDQLDAVRGGVPRALRAAVAEHTRLDTLQIVQRQADEGEGCDGDGGDGAIKYLLRSPDGALTEAVRIPLARPGRYSLCLSSQVGCAMGCAFCATGRLGLLRQLEAWEIVATFRAIQAETVAAGERAGRDERISGAVFMGQGEPLRNYDEVLRATRVLSDPCGGRIHQRAISISTVGLAPAIRRLTGEGLRVRLVVSLTSALPERRRHLLPVASQACSLEQLADALRHHARATGQRITIAWVVLGGVNTDHAEVAALERLLGGVPLRINLIDVNDPREDGFRRAAADELARFIDELQRLGAPVVRRYSAGARCHGACGMLANQLARIE